MTSKKASDNFPKILIGVPILAWSHEFAESFLNFWTDLMTYHDSKRRFHVGFRFIYRKPVHIAEELLAEFAIQSECTHLLLMDDDILDVTADDLFKLLDADKDAVGGIMHTGGFPYAMCAFRRYDTSKKVKEQPLLEGPARLYEVPPEQRVGVQKVDLISFGFTLLKTSLFKDIPKPWFKCDKDAPTDSWFADELLDRGKSFYAHFDVWLNHRGITKENRHLHFSLGQFENERKQGSKGGNIIHLTPEEMARHESVMIEKMRVAEEAIKAKHLRDQKFYEKTKKPVASLIKGDSNVT